MSLYQLTFAVKQDLIGIRRYTLKKWGKKQSISYLEELKNTMALLSDMPLMGKNCIEDLGKDIYQFFHGSHAIYYQVMSDSIIIIAILNQNMVPEKHLRNRYSLSPNFTIG